ncbi:P-loop containing nucleoside triphosphate hydrolase protein [Vararia minispora EC-137]|uniref:P-loop containing nucleoside triphosphate hydrolase protein n=1 Tax=Vararia minispora EC-137 TaxID=1314806 RepID=A0ACB8QCW9_9AGAM|nr:P-loop containing nucleoside triphosphate hydrolase protein [Vararia minispora EC-137]
MRINHASTCPLRLLVQARPYLQSRSELCLNICREAPGVNVTVSSRLQTVAPLAERLRPSSLDEFVGQTHLTGPDSLLLSLSRESGTGSLIFWGPPGCGKTTLARLMAKRSNAAFKELSATVVGINDVRPIFEEAKNLLQLTGRRTIIFLDEIHRFTRSQQDVFLPYLEQGLVQLIGATTENPSFKINGALLSRCRVFVLERLTDDELLEVLTRALDRVSSSDPVGELPSTPEDTRLSGPSSRYPHVTYRILKSIASLSAGDARTALSLLELALVSHSSSEDVLLGALRKSVSTSYDRTGDDRYDLISALHKSVRGSQPSAALYWLARMLEAGEDPVYICRRMVVCASEDVGLADNHALPLATAVMQACQQIGMPECRINLAHLVCYLAEAPKSTRSYEAYNLAVDAARQDMTLPVPLGMRNAPTRMMKEMGYSEGYRYNPDYAHPVTNEYLPEKLHDKVFLRSAGDLSGKEWDGEALRAWEQNENGGVTWQGGEIVSGGADS